MSKPDSEPLSDLESVMWSLEADPFLSSTFANLTIFDRSPDLDRLRRRLWRATRVFPRLRRRIQDGFGPMAPRWVDDPRFDLDRHLRRMALPPGSTEQDLPGLAAELVLRPFDPNHPLWEFVVIEGLPGGRTAMIQKLHHTITDGEGGIELSLQFIDLERDSPDPPPPEVVRAGTAPDRTPLVDEAAAALEQLGRTSSETMRRLFESASDLARNPARGASVVSGLPADGAAMAQSLVRQFGVFDQHRSPLWRERSLERTFHVHEVSLPEVKRVSRALGGSVNDLFVAAAAGGAGAYHRARGAEVDELRISMPVSTRRAAGAGGNDFTPTRVLVPVGPDPVARFEEIHRRLAVTKHERSMGLMSTVAGLGRIVPSALLVRLIRQQVATVDFTASNLRAAPFDLYIAGALMEANYPVGPLMGTAWNLTTMSYRGRLNLGLHVDAGAVEKPEDLARAVWAGFDELLAAA